MSDPAITSPARPPSPASSSLACWLFIVAALIMGIVTVGGITRLTESGLSITEWKPVTGALPPLNGAQWQVEFSAYQRIPQYTQVNGPAGMTLAEYKFIYFWEWAHRLIARVIGMAFALPLAWFWLRGMIPPGYRLRLLGLLALGGFQGFIGWWMVSSGLGAGADVKVAHYRLAAHLLTALVTLGALIWTALDLRRLARGEPAARLTGWSALALAALLVQLFYGALVAGMRGGVVAGSGWFNPDAWPLMQGRLVPDGIDWSQGAGHALLSDPFLTHFIHRWWAWVAVALLIVLARQVRARLRAASVALHSAFGVQIGLGIATVYSGVALWLAVLHQLTGALLVAATVWAAHVAGRSVPARKA
jgi:cytochrome c oxidase assembly protein subunit 15